MAIEASNVEGDDQAKAKGEKMGTFVWERDATKMVRKASSLVGGFQMIYWQALEDGYFAEIEMALLVKI